jgi:ATP-dependent Zn protease
LGYAQYLPNENGLKTTDELLEEIIILLGGRCAEELFFGEVNYFIAKNFRLLQAHRMIWKERIKLLFIW